MEGLVIVIVLFAPALLLGWLRKTLLWWTPGAALAILGLVAFGSVSDTHGDVGGVAAMGNGVVVIGGMCLLGYALVCLVVGARGQRGAREPALRPVPVELPPAVVVKDLSNT
ncbi:MAG TPA: hypothetical protein VGD37_03315 [Kofleriaceae bacterium]